MTPPLAAAVTGESPAPAVELVGIGKRFGAVVANDGVDLVLRRGSVHAVMGENGAGKSTLMSMLFGLLKPDSGEIHVDGVPVQFDGPLDAIAAGLGMVHQHFRLFDSMTVADNVVYGAEPTRAGLIDRRAAAARVRELSERYGLETEPTAVVGSLSAGARQRVEILKALHRDARILILDEPTAVLTPSEVTSLFTVIRRAADAGTTVVLVTHKIHEVLAVSDEVTVLRDGRVTGRFATSEATSASLVHAMTGREIDEVRNPGTGTTGAVALEVDHVTVGDPRTPAVHDVSLTVHRGEIVGVAGVSGNGQHELVAAVLGTVQAASGRIRLLGEEVGGRSVRDRRAAGLAVIPEDRRGEGTAVTLSVAENVTLGHHRTAPIGASKGLRRGWMSIRAELARARELIADYDVRTSGEQQPIGALSGGNAQKVVIARELSHGAPVLIAEQPTQGVDVGAIESIHQRLLDYRAGGGAVLLVSHEISELLALADRIVVMYSGRVVAEFSAAEATTARIGAAMAGAAEAAAAPEAAPDTAPAPADTPAPEPETDRTP
ncbi:ABC transporter ATP-binding protein [Herbiconiux sp. CPCC 203407]|uniref:ABC transporter ATP-binding protein n=1 Tax=Herbiconiux oxytropis TaxID=2970915 RepID=A0AA41XEZ7_9MICO|nr:ABC transporter ATP-binding protein [Herbiconiux oxytropis]MCS5720996.1 ABC transporter ATP-binding protein [Herbiconiux oxytropis]MCS5724473.1 ABC transporter ATP-binding protein [Herbiconiux oxytropis]